MAVLTAASQDPNNVLSLVHDNEYTTLYFRWVYLYVQPLKFQLKSQDEGASGESKREYDNGGEDDKIDGTEGNNLSESDSDDVSTVGTGKSKSSHLKVFSGIFLNRTCRLGSRFHLPYRKHAVQVS